MGGGSTPLRQIQTDEHATFSQETDDEFSYASGLLTYCGEMNNVDGADQILQHTSKRAVDTCCSSAPPSAEKGCLYKVMEVRGDVQDLSFVEKVLLHKPGILALCAALLSAAAAEEGGNYMQCLRQDINDDDELMLQSLLRSQAHLEVVGYCGDKKIMQQLLRRRVGICNDDLHKGILDPGLYACLLYPVLHIFLWLPPTEDQPKEASRKDLACNFLRYITDLCSTVHICIPECILPTPEVAARSNTQKKKGTRRSQRTHCLQVSRVKASENDINVSPGFSLCLPLMLDDKFTAENSFLLSEGLSRCALLFSRKCREIPPPLQRVERTTIGCLPALMEQWQNSPSDVDFTRLPDEGFLLLLMHTDSESFKKYEVMEKCLQDSIKQHREMEYYSSPAQLPVDRIDFVRSFFQQTLSDCQQSMNQLWGEYCLAAAVQGNACPGSETSILHTFLPAHLIQNFSVLEEMFLTLWTGQDPIKGQLGMIFEGDTIQIIKAGTMDEAVFPKYQDCGINIVSSSPDICKKAPMLLNQQACLTHGNIAHPDVAFIACNGCFPDDILLAGVTLQMRIESRTVPVQLVRLQSHNSVPGLLLWLDCLCQKQFCQFQRGEAGNFSSFCQDYYLSLPDYMLRESVLPILEQKLRFECRIEQEKLVVEQKRSAEEFLAHLKQNMGKKTGQENTLSILEIEVKRKSKSLVQRLAFWYSVHEEDELVLTIRTDLAPRVFLMWKPVELVPRSNDIKETLQHSSGHKQQKTVIPRASPESQFGFQVDSENEKLLKCVLLQSSAVLFFVQDIGSGSVSIYMHPHLGCQSNMNAKHIARIQRGCDIIAFDESSRTVAFYDKLSSVAKVYRFDETFEHHSWTGVEIHLNRYFGNHAMQWMGIIPGKREVVLIDDSWRVGVLEITQSATMIPKHIQLPGPFVRATISSDGSCLICLYPENGVEISSQLCSSGNQKLLLRVYVLGDSPSYLKDVPVKLKFSDITKLDARVVLFGSQMHLVVHSSENPKMIVSLVLRISTLKESIALSEECGSKWSSVADSNELMEKRRGQSCPHLDYIFHIYDKFPTCPPLLDQGTSLHLTLVLAEALVQKTKAASPSACTDYVQTFFRQLSEKGKSFENLRITVASYYLEEFLTSLIQSVPQNNTVTLIGTWISNLLSLVPVQIARAENNSLRPLINGLEANSSLSWKDAVSMSNLIQFGFYDVILNGWNGNITVISSMGKQSSGKSYLLNHLTGSLYDVAGGRCTDGVWMTTRISSDCLYVLLDFEGLGSFERTDQEDMLLSLLSAALSNVTLFNKKDFHLDKEMELLFHRFQSGLSLVKKDPKLFQGVFYIVIKDVDTSDVEDLKREFVAKISKICCKNNDNFLLKMYNGAVQIAMMAPFRSVDFQDSVQEIADSIQNVPSSYKSGRSFMRDMKLLIAQICAKDWSPLDSKRVALRIQLLRQHLTSAVRLGCLSSEYGKRALLSFDTEEEVEDFSLQVGDVAFELPDTGLELFPFHPSTVLGSILEQLKCEFEKIELRTGEKDETWFVLLEKFLLALVERRKKRIFLWLECNSSDFSEDGDVQKLMLEANAALAELKEGLTPCSSKCTYCFLKCVLDKGHPYDHSCKGSHACTRFCTFCLEEGRAAAAEQCSDVSGHDGPHDCKKKSHTCGRRCHWEASSSNCNRTCSDKVGHSSPHRCNSLQHTCKMFCDAPVCKNMCKFPLELGDHEKHACHQNFCFSKCLMPSCTRSCATEDHFHALDPDVKHLCENEHLCLSVCVAEGICEVQTEIVKQIGLYQGKRDLFEYEYQSEQTAVRKGCCIVIPAFRDKHDGMHVHTSNPNAIHNCDQKCPSCGYFCDMPYGHSGFHNTVHGNMTLTRFVSESSDIDIMDRKYEWGESGKAEMCMMHCGSQGRGHIHLIPCPKTEGGVCTSKLYDGARHETRKYGPDVDIPKDEMTHETYWRHVRFWDPCTEEEQELFALCDHYCRSEEHESEITGITKTTSYCVENLWHAPISRVGQPSSGVDYVSDDGHHFNCNHSMDVPVSVIFVIDKSGSMLSSDITPTLPQLHAKFPNRLGCVYESILQFIRVRLATVRDDTVAVLLFDTNATIAVPPTEMTEDIVNDLCNKSKRGAGGGTTYSSGLLQTEGILRELVMDPATQVKKPIVIFLSDRGNNGGADPVWCVKQMKKKDPGLILHTIMFGNDPYAEILMEMARAGEGTYQRSLDEVQLASSFQGIAESLRSKTTVLMH